MWRWRAWRESEQGEHPGLMLLHNVLAGHAFDTALLAAHCRDVCVAQAVECGAVCADEAELTAVATSLTLTCIMTCTQK